uniref:Uncharacterized protein n=1 Tax=Arundo donax TaxID=35708 RepID=A0A0A9A6K1_ARUDO
MVRPSWSGSLKRQSRVGSA